MSNKFKVGQVVHFDSKSMPDASGDYKVESFTHASGILASNGEPYVGYVYKLKDLDGEIAETSLSEGW